MNKNTKALAERKKELANLKVEWETMKKQEENLKKQFYASPKNSSERASIKNQLTRLQKEKFEKKECGKSMSIDTKNEELFERLKNPTGPATDPGVLASQIKEELREILNGSRKMETGDTVGDIWEANHSQEFCYFGPKKEIKEAIANLPRKRQEPLDLNKITTRMVRVKRKDLNSADFDEIISLIRQVKNFLEEKDKQERQQTENIKLNNPHLFTQWKCSTDGKYNGRRKWENWHTFSGKHNGFNYTIYVPDNHFALTNCLFDDGWGTNSEVSKFFVVEGVAKPTTLSYWNVAKQRNEIVSEAEAQKLIRQGKEWYISYKTYVDLNDKITIDHYQENGQQDLGKPVSGVNKLVESSDHKNMSGVIVNRQEEANHQLDNEFLLKYFQERDIKQIELTLEGNLLIEYNSGKSEIITKKQVNNQGLQKVISYYQKNDQTSLNQQDLINMANSNSALTKTPNDNNRILIGCSLGGALIIGVIIGLAMRKNKVKKNNL